MAANNAVVGILRAMLTADTANFDTGMRKAGDTLKGVGDKTKKVGDEIAKLTPQAERMIKSFQGDKLIYTANNLVAAITKVGGATKLSESQQANANKTLTDAIALYVRLGKTVPAAWAQAAEATKKVIPPTEALAQRLSLMDRAASALKGSFAQMFASFTLADLATRAITAMAFSLQRVAADGAKLTAIEGSFQRLAAGIGQSGDAMLGVTRGATKGLISDLDLMQSSNKAILLGLPVTATEMGTLSKAAITLGRAMGLDATTALDNLITALGRSSPLILDNLGLTVKVGEANEAYALSLGKTVGQLTDAEKKLAFYRAAMDAALKKTQELGEVQLGVIDQLSRIGVSVGNLVTSMASGANQSKTFAGALGVIAAEAERATQRMNDLAEARRNLGLGTGDTVIDFIGPGNPLTGAGGVFDIGTRLEMGQVARELARLQAERSLALAKGSVPRLPTQPGIAPAVVTEAEIRALEESSRKLEQRFERLAALGDSLFGRDVIARAQDMAAALGSIGNISLLSADKQQEVNRIVTEAIAVYARLGQDAPARLIAIASATTQLLVNTAGLHDVYAAMPPVIKSARASLNAYILIAQTGTEAMLDHAAATKAAREELLRLGMVPPAAMGSENASGEARQISREQLNQRLQEQRQQIVDFWKRQAGQLEAATIGRLGTLLVGQLGHDVTGELKAAADEAELDFLRIKRSGRATAKELQIAFERWREAEDRANFSFGERWTQFMGGIKQTFVGVLDDMLQHFLRSFIGGLIKGIAGAKLAERLGASFSGGVGGGGNISNAAGYASVAKKVAGLFGLGGGGAAVTTMAAPGIPVVAGVGGTVAGAAPAGGVAGMGFLSNPAFWTNPYTAAAAAAIGTGLLVWKKGLFRGGAEALHVNPRRDKFLAQFGGPGTGPDSGFHKLAAKLTSITGQSGGGALHASLRMADSVKEWERAQAAIVGALAGAGMKGIKSFQLGGFVPPGAVWPAILHGNAFGEDVIPRTSAQPSAGPSPSMHLTVNISSIDARGVREFVESRDFLDSLDRAFFHNKGFIATRVRPSLVP